ncbi:hypothetical protein ABT010_00115 [Streptomyces sp. NPDC002668]|uniref:hypothetical protein n=1 Tax=Streptomyces sp. NPDC002668 TaxID=3154422 RepID=UPI003323588A
MGVGTVSGEPQPFEEALLTLDGEVQRMADLALQGNYRFAARAAESNDEEYRREWVVPVDWEHAVPRGSALWRTGFFANQKPLRPRESAPDRDRR